MIKKFSVVFLTCCFLSATVTMNAFAFGDLQQAILDGELALAHVKGEIELTDNEIEDLRGGLLINLEETLSDLGMSGKIDSSRMSNCDILYVNFEAYLFSGIVIQITKGAAGGYFAIAAICYALYILMDCTD